MGNRDAGNLNTGNPWRRTTSKRRRRRCSPAASVLALLLASSLAGCPADPPPPYETITLAGGPYERGFAHGERFASKIRSLYTQLLTSSLLPSLNRERPDIAAVLIEYQGEEYDDGRFAYQVLVESAYELEESIPGHLIEEMRGIADGADLPYQQILVLNTFVDTVLGVRTLQRYLDQWQAPKLMSLEVLTADAGDRERWIAEPYEPLPHAHFVGVPAGASLRVVIEDETGVDPSTVRLRLDDDIWLEGDEGLVLEPLDEEGVRLQVTLTPPEGLPASSVIALGVEAGNRRIVDDPPPTRARFMRPQWIALATEGIDALPGDVPNLAADDVRFPPPPIAFAAEGEATPDGARRLAHHFSLLDAGTAHKHVVLFAHHPDDGLAHVTVGWTGLVGGFSGMSEAGLVWSVNHSDTLDNPVVGQVRRHLIAARLLSEGLPVTMLGRELLAGSGDVETATDMIVGTPATVGWNHLLAGPGGLRVVEADGDILGRGDRAEHVYGPAHRDEHGRRLASAGDGDIRTASHFVSNADDIDTRVLTFDLGPQRYWSPFWHRSLRAFHLLGDMIEERMGSLCADAMIEILREEDLIHPRDSMNAVVYEPEAMRLWLAAGSVPATDSPFEPHDVATLLEEGP